MKNKALLLLLLVFAALLLTGCGKDDEESEQFRTDIENFCINISTLDTSINNIDASSDTAKEELLGYIDQLDEEFRTLASLDFPEEFNYLEALSAEASNYMSEAASAYHTAYSGEEFAQNYSDYALENYKRAYKRVQIIITYLHGGSPQEAGLTE